MSSITITVLGSGTSTGVPLIGCDCKVCSSDSPANRRLRSSLFISTPGGNILIDTSTDLRQQALLHRIRKIDAVLFTHCHADHIHGIDELRSFNHIQQGSIPCYGHLETIKNIKRIFYYIFEEGTQVGGGIPKLNMHTVDGEFLIAGESVLPVPVLHGRLLIYGYRIGNAAYITDCSEFPASSLNLLEGLEVLILNALQLTPHPTHFSLGQAVELISAVKPKRGILTHLGHQVDCNDDYGLPRNVELAYDGMVIRCG